MFDRIQIWLLCAALALFPTLAAAQSPIKAFPPGTFQNRAAIDAATAGSFGITFGNSIEDSTGQTTYTLASVSFPSPFSNRYEVISVCIRSSNLITTPTVTIGGISATKVIESVNGSGPATYSGLFQVPAAQSTGTSATVVISSFGSAALRAAVQGYSVVTNTSALPSGGATAVFTLSGNNMVASATYPSNSRAISAMCQPGGTTSTVPSPASGVTIDHDAVIGVSTTESFSAHDTTNRTGITSYQINTSALTAAAAAVVAAWAP